MWERVRWGWETTKMHRAAKGGARAGGTTVITWMGNARDPASWLGVSGQLGIPWDARAHRFRNTYLYYHIRVLLVKTNQMIYICCIKYGGTTCALAVGDVQPSVGADEDVSCC